MHFALVMTVIVAPVSHALHISSCTAHLLHSMWILESYTEIVVISWFALEIVVYCNKSLRYSYLKAPPIITHEYNKTNTVKKVHSISYSTPFALIY